MRAKLHEISFHLHHYTQTTHNSVQRQTTFQAVAWADLISCLAGDRRLSWPKWLIYTKPAYLRRCHLSAITARLPTLHHQKWSTRNVLETRRHSESAYIRQVLDVLDLLRP